MDEPAALAFFFAQLTIAGVEELGSGADADEDAVADHGQVLHALIEDSLQGGEAALVGCDADDVGVSDAP